MIMCWDEPSLSRFIEKEWFETAYDIYYGDPDWEEEWEYFLENHPNQILKLEECSHTFYFLLGKFNTVEETSNGLMFFVDGKQFAFWKKGHLYSTTSSIIFSFHIEVEKSRVNDVTLQLAQLYQEINNGR